MKEVNMTLLTFVNNRGYNKNIFKLFLKKNETSLLRSLIIYKIHPLLVQSKHELETYGIEDTADIKETLTKQFVEFNVTDNILEALILDTVKAEFGYEIEEDSIKETVEKLKEIYTFTVK